MSNNLVEKNMAEEKPHLSSTLNTEVGIERIEIKQELQDTETDKEEVSSESVKNEPKKMGVENSTYNVSGDFCDQVTVVDNYSDVINIKYEVDIKDEIVDDDYEGDIQINKEIPNQITTVDDEALKFVEVTYEDDFEVDSLPCQVTDRNIKVVCENTQQATIILNDSPSDLIEVKDEVNLDIESIDINHCSQKSEENIDNKGTKWQQCLFCEHKTKTRYNLRRHIEAKHSEIVKWHQCQFCKQKVKCKESLRRHIKFNHDDNTEWLYCTVCDFRTKRRFHLNKHIKSKHSEDSVEWYDCNFCDMRTRNKGNLRQHLKFKHRIINLV